jgi:hypothetical protein
MKVEEVVSVSKHRQHSAKPPAKTKKPVDTSHTAPSKAKPFNKPKSQHLS